MRALPCAGGQAGTAGQGALLAGPEGCLWLRVAPDRVGASNY